MGGLVLIRYWDILLRFIPPSFSPNWISLFSFVIQCVSFLISFVFSKGLTEKLESWACFINGICLFLSQTCSKLDGLQARRCKCSSGIGHIINSGFGSPNCVLECMKLAASFNFGLTYTSFYLILLAEVGYFLSILIEYLSQQNYSWYMSFSTEGLIILSIFHLIAGFFPSLESIVKTLPVTIVFFSLFGLYCVYIIIRLVVIIRNKKADIGKILLALLPTIVSVLVFVANFNLQHSKKIISPFFLISIGLCFQYMSQKLVFFGLISRHPIKLFNIWSFVYWIGAIFPIVYPSLNDKHYFWLGYFACSIGISLISNVLLLMKSSEMLSIPLFSVKQTEPDEFMNETENSNAGQTNMFE